MLSNLILNDVEAICTFQGYFYDLVNKVFAEFVAVDYSEEGNKSFNDYLKIKLEEVTNDVQSGHKRIWGYYLNADVKRVTVNSSPYAVCVYERLGFVKTGEQQEQNGIIYVPMEHRF